VAVVLGRPVGLVVVVRETTITMATYRVAVAGVVQSGGEGKMSSQQVAAVERGGVYLDGLVSAAQEVGWKERIAK
jgi:hypothetical protein